ncbi:translation elongation factor Ts [bacterium 3DAC]|nr:translation elongation factor Ts [Dictyoglomota bacterium]UZN22875.1 translation elongation factor Ts [bacterium 3DAC]
MQITAQMVKQLREMTGAGMMDCKKALQEAGGDFDKAVKILRERGLAKAAKKAGRTAKEGMIHAYIHGGGRIGVMVEVNCETDFVARTDDFKNLVNDIALHIAAYAPRWVKREDVPEEIIEQEKEIYRKQALQEGKPEHVVEKIVEGKMKNFYKENVLMEQPFVKDEDKTVEEVIKEAIAKIGENIVVRRFVRWELGEES